jgi:hypothetical protein
MALAIPSADGRILARFFRQEVQLHDVVSGAFIGRPLKADVNTLDFITRAAFSANDLSLRARSGFGHDVHWPLEPEARAGDVLAGEIDRLLPSTADGQVVYAPNAAERQRLRSTDPGPRRPSEPRPAIELAHNARPGARIPARTSDAPSHVLDLAPVYDRDLAGSANTFWNFVSPARFPAGTQLVGGVDFDIRGYVQLGASADETDVSTRSKTGCIDVPAMPVAAFHVLAQSSAPSAVPTGEAYGQVVIHYRDGAAATVPLRAGLELPGFAGQDSAVPELLITDVAYLNRISNGLSAPRLLNPEPDRLVRCIELESTRFESRLVVFAVTAEPLPAESL